MYQELKKWRQDLHKIPELGLVEHITTAYLMHELQLMGYNPQKLLDTGAYVYIDLNKESTIAFRSDIDALEITEKNKCSFSSTHQGYMHACGHDGHMATLLGLAKKIKECNEEFEHNILLLFQPAEESPGGARLIVENGILDKYNVKAIFGMHLMPFYDEGVIACKPGALMAQNGEIDIIIHGKTAHAGLYHQGVDSIIIASELITQFQSIISRQVSAFDPCVLHIGKINGGSARNIVADTVEIAGTLRTFSEDTFTFITSKMQSIVKNMEETYDCEIKFSCPPMYPPVINDKGLFKQLKSMKIDNFEEIEEPFMLSEDFSYYQKAVPGIFFFLGTRSKIYTSGLHTETFNFDEKVLETGVNVFYALAKNIELGEL